MPLLSIFVVHDMDSRSGPVSHVFSGSPELDEVFNNGNCVFIQFGGILAAGILAKLRPPGRYCLYHVRQVTGHGEYLLNGHAAIFGQFAAGSSAGSVFPGQPSGDGRVAYTQVCRQLAG